MARITIRYLTARPGRGGRMRYFWQPWTALRQAGFRPLRLSDDLNEAIAQAEDMNRRLDAWRANEAPAERAGKARAERGPITTMPQLIRAYKASRFWRELKPATQAGYDKHLRALGLWAGSAPVMGISAKAVETRVYRAKQRLRDALAGDKQAP